MRSRSRHLAAALGLTALVAAPLLAIGAEVSPPLASHPAESSPDLQNSEPPAVRSHVVRFAGEGATIVFLFEGGGSLELGVTAGAVTVNGSPVGSYPVGGALAPAWRELALSVSRGTSQEALALVQRWDPPGISREERTFTGLIRSRVANLTAVDASAPPAPRLADGARDGGDALVIDLADLSHPDRVAPALASLAVQPIPQARLSVPGGVARVGGFSVGTRERLEGHLLVVGGDADISGTVHGNVATVRGNLVVHPGGIVTGDVIALDGEVRDLGGEIAGRIGTLSSGREPPPERAAPPPPSPALRMVRNGLGVLGSAFTLLLLGFGLVMFGREPLEVVSDTAGHSFSRSLLVGVLGQILVLPTVGLLVAGLVLTVAGILLVPFAVAAIGLLLLLALLGGLLAVIHAMGETVTRRQLAAGAVIRSANSYRYVLMGVGALTGLWLGWALLGWVPLAGPLMLSLAALATWLLATVGIGAVVLSRGGLRDHFAGRLLPAEALTDEYLWATPRYGVAAVTREQVSGGRQGLGD